MRIQVDKIPSAGTARSVSMDVEWARDAASTALDGTAITLTGRLTLEPPKRRIVEVAIVASASANGTCDRCGEAVLRSVETECTLRYLPAQDPTSTARADEEIELVQDDLDIGWYEDGSLVLADVLTEALALATPTRTLCEDSGGCDARTTALLEAAKPEMAGHPAFAALKNLKN